MPDILRKVEALVLFALLASWSFVWDYNGLGDFQRDGKFKLMLLSTVLLAALRFARTWHWSVAIFYVYLACSWLNFCFSQWLLPTASRSYAFDVLGHEEMAAITALLFLCPLIASRITRRDFESLTIAAALIHAVIGVLNLRGIYPFLPLTIEIPENLPVGLLGQQTILGPFLAYGYALALLRAIEAKYDALLLISPRWLYVALAAFLGAVALLTKSSMTYGALAAVTAAILLFYRGWKPCVVLAGLALLALLVETHFGLHPFHTSGRLEPWADAISLWRLRPWFGFGIGSWEPISRIIQDVRHYRDPWIYLHSDPLQVLFELGYVGLALAGLVAAFVAARIVKVYRQGLWYDLTWVCALAVFGVDSCANFVLHLVPHGPIFALAVYRLIRPRGSALDEPEKAYYGQ